MSVVNKMLQDLEARKAEPNASSDYQAPESSSSKRIYVYGALGLLVLLVGTWLYLDNDRATQVNSPQQTNIPAEATNDSLQSEMELSPELVVEQSPQSSDVTSTVESSSSQNNQQPLTAEQLQAYSFNQNRPAAPPQDINAQQSEISSPSKQPVVAQNNSELNRPIESQEPVNLTVENDPSVDPKSPNIVSIKSRSSDLPQADDQNQIVDTDDPNPVFEVRSSQNIDSVEGLKQQVQIALRKGDQKEAINLLSKLLEKAPENASARKRLAAMLFAQGNHLQADSVLREGVILQPDNQEMRIMQARLWVQMKNPAKALELLNGFDVSAVQAPDYISYRASLAQQVSSFDIAKSDYRQLTQSQPANARWWLGLAVAEERLGNNQPALQAYINAKDLDQLSSEVNKFVQQRIQYLAGVK